MTTILVTPTVMTPTLKTRTAAFACFMLCAAGASASALRALIALALHDDTSSHVLLVPFVAAALVFVGRDSIFTSVVSSRFAGTVVSAIGVCLALGSRMFTDATTGTALSVAVAGFVVLLLGGFLLCYGAEAARAALFPLAFLAFTIPIPSAVLAGVTLLLKTGSREAVSALFTLTGTPYYREGFTYSLPSVVIEIADECSGIRSTIALLLTSALASYMFLRTGWKRAVVVLAVLPLAVLKNGIRIVTLTLLAMHVDPGFLTGELHHDGGIVFFLLTLALLAPLVVLLHSSEAAFPRINR